MKTVEDLTNAIGSPGRFQIMLCAILSCSYLFTCFGHLGMAFYAAKTDHHCFLPNSSTTSIKYSIPNDGKNGKDQCHLSYGVNKTKKTSCLFGWTYNLHGKEKTIISEWNLVCDNMYKSNVATVLYFCGVLLGTIVISQLSDRFGRKPVFLFTTFSPVIVGLVIFFTNNYIVFAVFRFILGFLLEGLQLTAYTMIVELLSSKYRSSLILPTTSISWGVGVMILALISYILQDWKAIQLFTTLCTLVHLPLIWFMPESFRWLLVRRRFDEANGVVEKICEFNKLEFPSETFDNVLQSSSKKINDLEEEPSKRIYTIMDIFKSPELRKRWGISLFVWISMSLSYYGLILNSSKLAGNKYLNFFIGGIFEVIIGVITIFAINRFGRKKPAFLYFIIGGITCISASVLPKNDESLDAVKTFLSLFGRTCLGGDFAIMFIYTSELFPTVIRNIGLGAGVFGARIGNILAPQITLLGMYTNDSVILVIFGVTTLISAGLLMMLPETLNKKIPETIEEVSLSKARSCTDQNVRRGDIKIEA